jgi:hypothetical protein
MNTGVNQPQLSVHDDVTHWFFNDYLPTWVGVVAGTIARGPEFILDYWAAPLHYSNGSHAAWLPDGPAVVEFLQHMLAHLKERGYTHTYVPDHRIHVYSDTGAAIEVIWSRCAAGHEIERLAAHFEIARGDQGWRIIGIQTTPTTASSLTHAWPKGATQPTTTTA